MIFKILAVVGFLFLLVIAGPTIIEFILSLIQAGQTVKDTVNP